MHEMPMPGGWTMSMMWMRMPGQTWPGAAASFLGMWTPMMAAMMLPSLVPMLWRHRQAMQMTRESIWLTAVVGTGYLFVWTMVGAAIFPLGAALASLLMAQPALARLEPMAATVVILIGGCLQLSEWKQHHLDACREAPAPGHVHSADAATAWRHGVCLGLHCIYSCAGITAIALVLGVMDFRVMVVATMVITLERLTPTRREQRRKSFTAETQSPAEAQRK
jgi:predicted metal-binding membrane protein